MILCPSVSVGLQLRSGARFYLLIVFLEEMILFIKHIDIEGPGTLGEYFQRKGKPFDTIDLGEGEKLPASLDRYDAIVSLGGPMNVYEEDKYPFLKDEDVLIKKVLQAQIPFLGICLGSQLLAKASGARVKKSPRQEIGFFDIELSHQGQDDPLFKNLGNTVHVFQWHEDMFEIPSSGQLLASSKECPHQVLKVGKNAYGLQFHVEITDKSIEEWSKEYLKSGPAVPFQKQMGGMLKHYQEKRKIFNQTAAQIYDNFLELL